MSPTTQTQVVTGLMLPDGSGWDMATAECLGIPAEVLSANRAVRRRGRRSHCSARQPTNRSTLGRSAVFACRFGMSGGWHRQSYLRHRHSSRYLLGDRRAEFERRGENGTFPIICRTEVKLPRADGHRDYQANAAKARDARAEAAQAKAAKSARTEAEQAGQKAAITWGVEALDLSAGTNVAWLGEQWGLFKTPADSEALAASCESTEGVVFVPALEGLGAPQWDFGARGTFLGLTRGTEASHMARAVLEGVAYRGAELLRAAEADGETRLKSLKIDGGMSRNKVFAQALANAAERPIEIAKDPEATSLGAAYLAGYATGIWQSLEEIASLSQPAQTIEPAAPPTWNRWQAAITQSLRWEESLSEIAF